VIVSVSDEPRHISLSASAAEYLALAAALHQGQGTLDHDAGIVVEARPAGPVVISLDAGRMVIQGSPDSLAILAEIVEDAASAAGCGGHVHIEYFPGHGYLGEGSIPVVLFDAD
jgi:hypothetical protein